MSETYISSGYFGRLKIPIPRGTVEDMEGTGELPDGLHVTYDGTMLYSDSRVEAYDSDGLIFPPANGAGLFRKQCKDLGFDVDPVKHYVCHWHSSSDSPMAIATLKEVFGE